MDSLGSLNAFVRAAEARSFTVAGRQLGVSSSAIGKAVARMGVERETTVDQTLIRGLATAFRVFVSGLSSV